MRCICSLVGSFALLLAGCGSESSAPKDNAKETDPKVRYKETYKGPWGTERTREYDGPKSQDPWKKPEVTSKK